ncbi:hypothetical protein ACFX2B_004925 [Malus domestica]
MPTRTRRLSWREFCLMLRSFVGIFGKLEVASFFQHQQIIPSQVFAAISTNVYAFTDASRIPTMSVVQSRHVNLVQAQWTTSSPHFVKINVDANWVVATDVGFAGIVVRDSFGSFVVVHKYCLNATSVAAAKVMAILCGCKLGILLGLNFIIVEFDSLESISCFMGKITNGR